MSERDEEKTGPLGAEPVIVRLGHGANCSSIGSVVDTLFVGAVLGSAICAAVAAAMKNETVTIAGKNKAKSDPPKPADDAKTKEDAP